MKKYLQYDSTQYIIILALLIATTIINTLFGISAVISYITTIDIIYNTGIYQNKQMGDYNTPDINPIEE